jgi:hypothetical protein
MDLPYFTPMLLAQSQISIVFFNHWIWFAWFFNGSQVTEHLLRKNRLNVEASCSSGFQGDPRRILRVTASHGRGFLVAAKRLKIVV